MTRTRRTFLSIIAVAMIGTGTMIGAKFGGIAPQWSDPITDITGNKVVELTIASSVTKQRWLEASVKAFSDADIRTSTGSLISIKVQNVLSGDSMEKILAGKSLPVVWSPGESSWVSQFDAQWSLHHNKPAMAGPCRPTIYAPSGIAVWRPMAEALGWPNKPVAWKTLIDLAAEPQGWSKYGHPEWGKLKLGYTHPQYSSAGMLFLTSMVYGISGKASGLTPDQVYSKPVEAGFLAMAQNTSKYGMSTTALLDMMARQGPDYLHAISAFEEGVVRFNLERGSELRFPLVFISPTEGTFWSDHPYCILDKADWVSPEQKEAATLFLNFLLAKEQQLLATDYFLRPLDSKIGSGTKLTLANGTDPSLRPESQHQFEIPNAATTSAVIDQFLATKRKAKIMLVLDVSGSMIGEPIRAATVATAGFLKRLDPHDKVGLMIFNEHVTTVSDIQPASIVSEELSRRVLQLVAGGGTNLNGAICQAVAKMKADASSPEDRLDGIVVLSDGADTEGEVSENRMFQTCLPASAEANGIKIFSIAFGDSANLDALSHISKATGGTMFTADASTVDQAYLKISAEQ